jgi:hypothetical protein
MEDTGPLKGYEEFLARSHKDDYNLLCDGSLTPELNKCILRSTLGVRQGLPSRGAFAWWQPRLDGGQRATRLPRPVPPLSIPGDPSIAPSFAGRHPCNTSINSFAIHACLPGLPACGAGGFTELGPSRSAPAAGADAQEAMAKCNSWAECQGFIFAPVGPGSLFNYSLATFKGGAGPKGIDMCKSYLTPGATSY